jgi:hypothetical protein
MICPLLYRKLFLRLLSLLAFIGLGAAPGWAAGYGIVQAPHSRTSTIQILLPPVAAEDGSYAFEIVLAEIKSKSGQMQMRATTTITKTGDGKTIRIREVVQFLPPDATQFSVAADGREFIFEAAYTEAITADGVPPRDIRTTFQQMFGGGPVGLKVRLG